MVRKKKNILPVDFAGIRMKNPLLLASGIAGYGEEYSDFAELDSLGGFITKTITPEPRPGNPPPRIRETPSGMVNSIGLENPGIDEFIRSKLPFLRSSMKVPLIVSFGGAGPSGLAAMAKRLSLLKGISALEMNISCPNVRNRGVPAPLISQDIRLTARTVRMAKKASGLPLIVKLSPNITDITMAAAACEDSGADALSMVNTYNALAFTGNSFLSGNNSSSLKPFIPGGLSGPAIRPLALRAVWETYRKVRIPIMGMGGITGASDILEFLACGAKTVALGCAFFRDPGCIKPVLKELEEAVSSCGKKLNHITGCVHQRR